MNLPKFIITMDGVLRMGMVDQHMHLLKQGDQCIGGGYYTFDFVGSAEGPFHLSRPANRI